MYLIYFLEVVNTSCHPGFSNVSKSLLIRRRLYGDASEFDQNCLFSRMAGAERVAAGIRLGLHPRGSGYALVAWATPSMLGRLHRDTTINRRAAVAAENQRRVWSLERCSRVIMNTFLALIRLVRVRGEDET